jgi:hypothetical protein
MRAGGCNSEMGWFHDAMQTDWSDDDAFPEMRRDFDNVADMVSADEQFRRKPQ